MKPHHIGTVGLELAELDHILTTRSAIALTKDALAAVKRSHAYLRDRLKNNDAPI